MCYKTAILMEPSAFASKLRNWMHGTTVWKEMDLYANMLGGNLSVNLDTLGLARQLPLWAFGDEKELQAG